MIEGSRQDCRINRKERDRWKSSEAVHGLPARDRPKISPARYGSILCSIARAYGALVTFEAGARTAWHTHPLGQTLIVTSGCGWTQCWGEPKEEIRPGDVVWCPPGKKHWHGATATIAMSHIAIVEKLNGKAVDWVEKVTDEQYAAGSGTK
jgi:mannose-6-phosphate isomerase-like protein (cupin superfamily)